MSRTVTPPKRLLSRFLLRVERLETRLALSASPVGTVLTSVSATPVPTADVTTQVPSTPVPSTTVVTTSPAPNSTVGSAVFIVSVTFNNPILPGSVTQGDILIERPDPSGNGWVSAVDPASTVETLDSTGKVLTLTLAQPLTQGTYQLVLSGHSGLTGQDGSLLAYQASDVPISQFTVAQGTGTPTGNPLTLATDLGTASSNLTTVSGSLDLQSNPGAVNLYKFTVPQGHHWRLTAEVDAQLNGSPLLAALSLFDAQGNPIAFNNVGRPNAPLDPYLFAGLNAGTYYLGVSGTGNLPGQPGGYNLITGQQGTTSVAQAGGAYTLTIAADVADNPIQVLGQVLNYADPLDPQPTGITLAFSGLLDLSKLSGVPSPGVQVVNQYGQVFGMTAVSFNEVSAQYTFLFNSPLPAGHYRVVVPGQSQGGLTDLAGLTPTAPGQAAGVLAQFDVKAAAGTRNPNNVGPLFGSISTGVSFNNILPAGKTATYRFVVTVGGTYMIGSNYTGGSLSAQLLGSTGPITLPGGSGTSGVSQSNYVTLNPGVYTLMFTNTGSNALQLSWKLQKNTPLDSQLDNGIGQGTALSLRLINPTSANLPATQSSQPDVQSASASGGSSQVGFYQNVGNVLVGRPSTDADHVTTVGPVSPTGSTALASSSTGIPQGIGYGAATAHIGALGRADHETALGPGESVDSDTAIAPPANGAMVVDAAPAAIRADEKAIAAADWLTRTITATTQWLSFAPAETPMESVEPIVLTHDDSPPRPLDASGVEEANFGAPLAFGFASLMALRAHPGLRRWLKRPRADTAPPASHDFKAGRGPHRRF